MTHTNQKEGLELQKLMRDVEASFLAQRKTELREEVTHYVSEDCQEKRSVLDKLSQSNHQYAIGYDAGYSDGYHCGVLDGWARGFDEGMSYCKQLQEIE